MHWLLFPILLITGFENHKLGLCDLVIYTWKYALPGCASCSAFTAFAPDTTAQGTQTGAKWGGILNQWDSTPNSAETK